jgi:hypothetical protein
MVLTPKHSIDELARAWVCRELHPEDQHDTCIYLCLVRPTKLFYPGGFYFWRVPDPSLKILMPACMQAHIEIEPGELLPLLKPIENKETK